MSIWKELTNPTTFAGQYDTEVQLLAPADSAPRPNGSIVQTNKPESVIGPGVVIEGKIDADSDIRIGGCVKGDVRVKGSLTLDPGGRILGAVNADEVTLNGQVEGNIVASGNVKLPRDRPALRGCESQIPNRGPWFAPARQGRIRLE